MSRNNFWTDDRVAELHKHVAAGLTAEQTGYRLGCTRNSVIGKCTRLGLRLNGGKVRTTRDTGKPRFNAVLLDNGTQRKIREMRGAGADGRTIAATVGVPFSTLRRWMTDHGIDTSKASRPRSQGYLMGNGTTGSPMARPHGFTAHNMQRKARAEAAEPQQPRPEPPGAPPRPRKPIGVYALKPGACKWPHGDVGQPGFAFCGAKAYGKGEAPRPYCPYHQEIAWVRPEHRQARKLEAAE